MKTKTISGIMLTLLLTSMLTLAFNIQPVKSDWTWTETIYIRADGSVDPDTAPVLCVDNITYTFTDNIYDEIVVERSNIVVDGAGYTLKGIGSGTGIDLSDRSNVTIKNTEIEAFRIGIRLFQSSFNSIYGNSVTNNDWYGILIHAREHESSNTRVYGNNITNNGKGIVLWINSSNTRVYGNNITNNHNGILLYETSNTRVYGNNITNNQYGIELSGSKYTSIYGNNITNNEYGIWLARASENSVYHNNFVDNTEQVYKVGLTNVWDDGYPSGGNYWSDYEEMYPEAEELDGSGIWDIPYLIDENNQDNYPLMSLWINGENGDGSDNGDSDGDILITHPFWMQWWFWTTVVVVIALAGAVYLLKKRKPPTVPTPPVEGTV